MKNGTHAHRAYTGQEMADWIVNSSTGGWIQKRTGAEFEWTPLLEAQVVPTSLIGAVGLSAKKPTGAQIFSGNNLGYGRDQSRNTLRMSRGFGNIRQRGNAATRPASPAQAGREEMGFQRLGKSSLTWWFFMAGNRLNTSVKYSCGLIPCRRQV